MWKVIQVVCLVETDTWCGTHVRVFPDNGLVRRHRPSKIRRTRRPLLRILLERPHPKSYFYKNFHAPSLNLKGKTMVRCIALVDVAKGSVAAVQLPIAVPRFHLELQGPLIRLPTDDWF